MIKKALSILLSGLIVTIGSMIFVQASTVEITKIAYQGNLIMINGIISSGNDKNITLKVVRRENLSNSLDDIFVLKETKSDENGGFTFEFEMLDEKNGIFSDGSYDVYAKGDDTEIVRGEFQYVTQNGRDTAINQLKNDSSINLEEFFSKTSPYRNALVVIGLPMTGYDDLTLAQQKNMVTIFKKNCIFKNITETSLISDFTKSLYLEKINEFSSSENITSIEKYNPSFEGTSFSAITDEKLKSWICELIYENKNYSTFSGFEGQYESANILYKINQVRYSGIEKLLGQYKNELGLNADSSYATYLNLSSSQKNSVNEKMVLAFSGSPAKSKENVISVLHSAVDAVYKKNNSSGGNGGGGGGSISTGNVTGSITAQSITSDYIKQGNQSSFKDLEDVQWAKEAIYVLEGKKIINASAEGTFSPDNDVTREEFIKLLVVACDLLDNDAICNFDDVSKDDWYYHYVANAVKNGVIKGVTDGLFGSGLKITRQDMAVIICRVASSKLEYLREFTLKDTEDMSDYAIDSIKRLYCSGFINGIDETVFAPKEFLTRAQAAKVIYDVFVK